jgi:hypothetical protein
VWGGMYTVVEVVGARNGDNEWGMGILPPKCGYRAYALDIAPACIIPAVGVHETYSVGST